MHPFRGKHLEHHLLGWQEVLHREARSAEAILVAAHHELIAKRGEHLHRTDAARHKVGLGDAVYLIIHRRFNENSAVAVYDE